jgi:sialate O-acetylesterase
MKALIDGWRTVWHKPDMPFYFVQLAPYHYGGDQTRLAEIWNAQREALEIPNTGMAVTTDIGNIKDIHPRNKQEVGRRLALWALSETYDRPVKEFSGPLFQSARVEGKQIRVRFTHTAGALVSRDNKPLTHFQIAGKDGKYVPAQAEIDGETVVVSSPDVPKPVAVRFAWHEEAEPNLANKVGLPASPFRSK